MGQQCGLQRPLSVRLIRSLKDRKDIRRVRRQNGFQTQVLQQGAAVRDIDTSQVRQHFSQYIVCAALDLAAYSGGPDAQHAGRGAILTGYGGLRLSSHIGTVCRVPLGMAGKPRTDFQHVQIIVKGLNIKISRRDPGLGKGLPQLQVRLGIAACQDQIRL